MSKGKKITVKKPMVKMPYEDLECFVDSEQFYYRSLKGLKIPSLSSVTFDCCHFENVVFYGDLSGTEFLDCIFINCDFSNAEIKDGGFYRCCITETKFIGSVVSNNTFKDVEMNQCLMELISFSSCIVGPVIFKESDLKDSFFQNCDLKRVRFDECDLSKINFAETKLKGVDVSTSIIDGISANPYDLKGLIIDRLQAYEFVKYLDIIIK